MYAIWYQCIYYELIFDTKTFGPCLMRSISINHGGSFLTLYFISLYLHIFQHLHQQYEIYLKKRHTFLDAEHLFKSCCFCPNTLFLSFFLSTQFSLCINNMKYTSNEDKYFLMCSISLSHAASSLTLYFFLSLSLHSLAFASII